MWLLRAWIPLAIAVTGVCGLVSVTVQQNYRQSLNDPQIQMAEDAGYALFKGDVPAGVVPRGQSVDLRLSLAPWIAVYDGSGLALESSGVLDGAAPVPPKGVLEAASAGKGKDTSNPDENRVTWEPVSGVRQAIVVVAVPGDHVTKYYVVAGRNMREVETREGNLTTMVALAWLVTLVVSFLAVWFCGRPERE